MTRNINYGLTRGQLHELWSKRNLDSGVTPGNSDNFADAAWYIIADNLIRIAEALEKIASREVNVEFEQKTDGDKLFEAAEQFSKLFSNIGKRRP